MNPEKIFYDEKIMPDLKINCGGALISPGFIDLQINGINIKKYIHTRLIPWKFKFRMSAFFRINEGINGFVFLFIRRIWYRFLQ